MFEKKPRAEEESDNNQYHHDEEQEVLQVFRVVSLIWYEFFDLAEVSSISFSALASAVNAHTTIHALTGTVLDISSKDFDVCAMELLTGILGGPYELNKASITRHILGESNFFSFHITLSSTTWEISSLSFLECSII